ncbi:unnamed protein product, partial [Strongylus vulgaris]
MLRIPKRYFLIRDVSFELCAGDMMALMSASESESRALLDVLSGQYQQCNVRAYVTREELPKALTVVQYLRINAAIHPPAAKTFKTENMIDQLLATLALALRRHTLCSRLSIAETHRLRIAAQLLKDADILICDNVAKDMDNYETAFVIDYLRDWAIKLNRIVVMCIAPSSFD